MLWRHDGNDEELRQGVYAAVRTRARGRGAMMLLQATFQAGRGVCENGAHSIKPKRVVKPKGDREKDASGCPSVYQ
jgi:hypothetical protein